MIGSSHSKIGTSPYDAANCHQYVDEQSHGVSLGLRFEHPHDVASQSVVRSFVNRCRPLYCRWNWELVMAAGAGVALSTSWVPADTLGDALDILLRSRFL